MSTVSDPTTPRVTLRDLPLAARITLSVFLICVGVGYTSALVQLHFQHAPAGSLLPSKEDAARVYHGEKGMSTFERLIRAHESLPFDGSGSMRPAFTTESSGWDTAVGERAEKHNGDEGKAVRELRKEREREIESVLSWIKAGGRKEDYSAHRLPDDFFKELGQPPEGKFFAKDENEKFTADVGQIIKVRCARCHDTGK
jgi:hypothetical protein